MREHSPAHVQVKAAGVRTLDALLEVMSVGVTRIGATATEAILEDFKARKAGALAHLGLARAAGSPASTPSRARTMLTGTETVTRRATSPGRPEQGLARLGDAAADDDAVASVTIAFAIPIPRYRPALMMTGLTASRTNASTQPWLPQLQRGLSGSIVTCPSSAALAALVRRTVDDDAATNAGADDEERRRAAALAGAERPLGEGEGAGVVDQPCRRGQRLADRPRDWAAGPVALDVDEERRRTGRVVEEPRHADPDGIDASGLASDGDQPADHRLRPLGSARPRLAARRDLAVLEHRPLDERATEIEPEVPHRPSSRRRPPGPRR